MKSFLRSKGCDTGSGLSSLEAAAYSIDPTYAGGAVTYLAATNPTVVTDSSSRLYIGKITTPADGGSGTAGTGGGGLLGGTLD